MKTVIRKLLSMNMTPPTLKVMLVMTMLVLAHTGLIAQIKDYATDFGLLNPIANIPETRTLFIQAGAELKKYLNPVKVNGSETRGIAER